MTGSRMRSRLSRDARPGSGVRTDKRRRPGRMEARRTRAPGLHQGQAGCRGWELLLPSTRLSGPPATLPPGLLSCSLVRGPSTPHNITDMTVAETFWEPCRALV